MTRYTNIAWISVVVLCIGLVGCGRNDADRDTMGTEGTRDAQGPQGTQAAGLRVVNVELGSSIDADRRVTNDMDDFAPTDTIYVSVETDGTQSGTLTARWTYEDGQVVDETSQTISPTGRTYTEFHIFQPGGLPAGEYNVEILLDGQSVETESFEIR